MKSIYPKQHILAVLLTGFVIASASSVAAQPTTGHQEQAHQEHQVQNRQGQQKQQRRNRQRQQGHHCYES